MSTAQLTGGVCERLQTAPPDDDVFRTPCTVQFLSIKKVTPTSATNPSIDRFRIIVSDGVGFVQAMLATQLNHLVNDNSIRKHSIAVIEKLTCNFVQEKRLIIILALNVIQVEAPKIGDPKALVSTASDPAAGKVAAEASSSTVVAVPPQQSNAQQTNQSPARGGRSGSIYPIEGLSPYQNNWTIKARVTHKSEMRTYSNQRGEGKLFNVTLIDDTGEIKGTAFNAVADALYDKFQEGKVYYVSKARVNLAKKKFSNLANDYELSFERGTEVEECHETTNVPVVKYNFVKLSELESLSKDTICDVIGVVTEVGNVDPVMLRQRNQTTTKRDLTIVDRTNCSVRLTLWGKNADAFDENNKLSVIAFKSVKIGEYGGGRTLSSTQSGSYAVDPDIEECFKERAWFDGNKGHSIQSLSNATQASNSGGFKRSEFRNLGDVKNSELGTSDTADYFSTRATIMHIKPENISYPACPTPKCNKKVFQEGDQWRCEKCNQSFPRPEYRYIISMAVADWSSQAWLQGFNDVGVTVFGMTADELVEKREHDELEYNAVMQRATCQTYNFSCRAKQDTWNDQTRVRYSILKIEPLDYKVESYALRDLLRSPWAQ